MKTFIFFTVILLSSFLYMSPAEAHEEKLRNEQINKITISSLLQWNLMRAHWAVTAPVATKIPVQTQTESVDSSCHVISSRNKNSAPMTSFCDSQKAMEIIKLQSLASN